MKIPKLTKKEREGIIENILDYLLDYADPTDMKAELRSIFKKGLPKDFVPYAKLDDECLIIALIEQLICVHEHRSESSLEWYLGEYVTAKKAKKIAKIISGVIHD